MYTLHDRVSFSRIDHSNRISVESVVNAMQDCALFHSEEIGRSAAFLATIHRAWLVSAWHVVFVKRPLMGELFDVHTWAYKFTGIFGHRNFLMETPEHEVLAYADSRWFYYDSEAGKPTRVDREESEGYGIEEPYDMDYSSRKVPVPDSVTEQDRIVVNPALLDTNGHMNNGQYVRLAAWYLPYDMEVSEFRAEYRNAAHRDDTLIVKTGWDNGNYYVIFSGETDLYFISEWRTNNA